MDFGRIPPLDEWRGQVLAVTDTAVREVARAVFDGKTPAIAEIGP